MPKPIAVGALDLDDLGAKVGEVAAEACRSKLRDLDYAHAGEEVIASHARDSASLQQRFYC